MKQNYRLFLLTIGIAVVLYTFLSLQYLLGIAAAVIIAIALIYSVRTTTDQSP